MTAQTPQPAAPPSRGLPVLGAAGFLCGAAGAALGRWDLPGFCWGVWISALAVSLVTLAVSALRALFIRPAAARRFLGASAWLRERVAPLPGPLLWALQSAAALLFALLMARVTVFLFGFYGIFLSFFAESEPLDLLGRNGFINSDFVTPALFLLGKYWPMVLGAVLADAGGPLRTAPWRGFVRPFARELAPLHLFVLLMPFVTLLFLALLGKEAYQTPAVVALLAAHHFFPKEPRRPSPSPPSAPAKPSQSGGM